MEAWPSCAWMYFGCAPLSDQETCVCVAQVVKTDTAEFRTTKHPYPLPVNEVVRIDRLAIRAAEDETALKAARELRQRRPYGRCQIDCSP